jgi:hypothetical protein
MLTTQQLGKTIREQAGNTIFKVRFIKRTNGDRRDMLCRLGVSKDVSGMGMRYDPVDKGLLTVWDMEKNGWRSVPLDAIVFIKVRGEVYWLHEGVTS